MEDDWDYADDSNEDAFWGALCIPYAPPPRGHAPSHYQRPNHKEFFNLCL